MVDQMTWVPESVHRRTVGQLRGWVIGLAIALLLALLVLGGVMLGTIFAISPSPVVVSSPRDCRLAGDAQDPKLHVVLDASTIVGADLTRASSLGPSDLEVEAIGVVSSLAPLSTLSVEEFESIVAAADENPRRLDEDDPRGVVVAVIDTDGESSGRLNGLRTIWVLGEPASEQDLPLGIDFTPATCTVTTAP